MAIFQKNRNYKRWDKTNLQTISGTYGEYQINKIKTALPKWQSGSVELWFDSIYVKNHEVYNLSKKLLK